MKCNENCDERRAGPALTTAITNTGGGCSDRDRDGPCVPSFRPGRRLAAVFLLLLITVLSLFSESSFEFLPQTASPPRHSCPLSS